MTRNLKPCGTIQYNNTVYSVYLEMPDNSVWVGKPSDETFGFGNYGNAKANTPKEALAVAYQMLEAQGI